MPLSLKDKDLCTVLIIEQSSSVRLMISEILKNLGYKNISSAANNKEALHVLEVEKINWIVSSYIRDNDPDSNVSVFHLLKIISSNKKLKNTLISLFIDEDQNKEELLYAFEMGLFSFHQKSYVKDSVGREIEQIFNSLNQNNWSYTLTSAEYIRLLIKDKSKSLLALEENLLSMFPGSASVLLHLAEAEFLNQRSDLAVSMLHQVEIIDKKLAANCKKLKDKFVKSNSSDNEDSSTEPFNTLGLNNVVIIDADTDVLYYISDLLKKVGVSHVEQFEDGSNAFKWLENEKKEPDLIIMEWKTFGISGPILIQKIRGLGYLQTPVVVISSLIEKSDFSILKEMGVDHCQKKPFDQNDFYASVIWATQQNRYPTEQKTLQTKIRRLLHGKKIEEAKRLMAHFFSDERIHFNSKLEIQAEYFFALGSLKDARDKGIEAIKHGGDSLLMLNLIGKSMLKLKEFEGALRCFNKANSISSLNIERLLNIAHASIETGDQSLAMKITEDAKKLDPTNVLVSEVECQIKIEAGSSDQAKNLMEKLDSGKNILSFMNNRAVSLAKNGRFEDSISLYKKTIDSLPLKWKELKLIVSYNLSLAYARYGELELAQKILKSIANEKLFDISKKSISLLKRVEIALSTGGKLELQEDQNSNASLQDQPSLSDSIEADNNFMDDLSYFEAKRGDIACYLVFFYLEGDHKKSASLIKDMPHFLERSSIEKPK